MIYFLQNTHNGEIKIGFTRSYRFKPETPQRHDMDRKHEIELQLKRETGENHRLRTLAVIDGDIGLEKTLHELLSHYHVRGEWFNKHVLDTAMYLVVDWCNRRQNMQTGTVMMAVWNLVAEGIGGVRLKGDVTWQGMRYADGELSEDVSGAKFCIDPADVADFARRLQIGDQYVPPPQPKGRQPSSMGLHVVKQPGQILQFENDVRIAELKADGELHTSAYIAKCLHCVAAVGTVWDVPASIYVKFTGLESPAPIRECFLLTVDLYEFILDKCAKVEKAYEAGQVTEENFQTLCRRMRDPGGVDDMARRYAVARDFSDQSPVPSPSV